MTDNGQERVGSDFGGEGTTADVPFLPDQSDVHATVGTMFRRDTLYMWASSLQLLSGVLVTPFLTRVLGLHQYGIFAGDLALLYVLYLTANLGLNIGIQRVYSQIDGDRKSRKLLAHSLVIVTGITALVYGTGPWWSPLLGFGHYPLSTRLTVVWSGLYAMTWICLSLLRCNERLVVFGAVCLLQGVIGVGVGTVAAYSHGHLASDVLWCTAGVQLIALAVALATIPPIWHGFTKSRMLLTTLRFSIPIVPLQISTLIIQAADRFVILRDLGPGPTGRYTVAWTLGAIGISMLAFLNLAWLPRIFAIASADVRAGVLTHSRDGIYKLLVPVTIGIALGGPIALRLWVPPSFRPEELIPVVVLTVAATIPVSTSIVHSQVMLAAGDSITVAIASIGAALFNIIMNLALVPVLGINGSALATLTTYLLLAIGMAYLSRRHMLLARPSLRLAGILFLAECTILASRYISIYGLGIGVRLGGAAICTLFALGQMRALQMR